MAKTDDKGRWLTPQGDAIPLKLVPKIDRKRDAMVERLFKKAEDANKRLVALRQTVDAEVGAFLAIAAKEHNLTPNKKGNYWFTSWSGDLRVEVKVSQLIDVNEQIKFAEQKIYSCFKRWSAGAKDEDKLDTAIIDAFKTDRKGRINVQAILALRHRKIDDAEWLEAMELIANSIFVSGSKRYVNFYRRDENGKWVGVVLDMARI